ncbi:MAG: DUF4412 domain-containing protein [Bacteroidetes bacterium]|nr:DUF4412 domain-containing protein [Bacteroidota bacterium]
MKLMRRCLILLFFLACCRLFGQPVQDFGVAYGIEFYSPRSTQDVNEIMSTAIAIMVVEGNKSYFEVSLDTILGTTLIYDGDSGRGVLLHQEHEDYYGVRLQTTELAEYLPEMSFEMEEFIERKDILGYSCKRVRFRDERGYVDLWVTPELKASPGNSSFSYYGIDGFPLEIEDHLGAIVAHYVADTVFFTPARRDLYDLGVVDFCIPMTYAQYKAGDFPSHRGHNAARRRNERQKKRQ